MMHVEPVKPQAMPSAEYIQQLRDLGASAETIRLALGEPKRRRWFGSQR